MRKQPLHVSRRGFTIVELLAVVCIAGVLAAVAVPIGRSFGLSSSLSAFAHAFLSHLQLARSEAIKRRSPVVLCKSADAVSCASAGGWDQGWIVFHDANGNGLREADEQVIQKIEAMPLGLRLQGNLNVARYVAFMPNGATRTTSGAFQAGTLTLCRASSGPAEGRQVVINAVGRPRLQKVPLASCD